jgi:hypothetical protein
LGEILDSPRWHVLNCRSNRQLAAGVRRVCLVAGSGKHQKEAPMDLWLALFWTGPIGVGVFLAGLGVLLWGIGQVRRK